MPNEIFEKAVTVESGKLVIGEELRGAAQTEAEKYKKAVEELQQLLDSNNEEIDDETSKYFHLAIIEWDSFNKQTSKIALEALADCYNDILKDLPLHLAPKPSDAGTSKEYQAYTRGLDWNIKLRQLNTLSERMLNHDLDVALSGDNMYVAEAIGNCKDPELAKKAQDILFHSKKNPDEVARIVLGMPLSSIKITEAMPMINQGSVEAFYAANQAELAANASEYLENLRA